MNYYEFLSLSTLNIISYAGKKFKLQQILFIPVQSKNEEPIVLYEDDLKVKRSNLYSSSKRLNYLWEKYLKKNVHPLVKDVNVFCDNDSRINPYTFQIMKQGLLHAVLFFNKNPEIDKEWAEEEMEILDLVSQFIKKDLLLE